MWFKECRPSGGSQIKLSLGMEQRWEIITLHYDRNRDLMAVRQVTNSDGEEGSDLGMELIVEQIWKLFCWHKKGTRGEGKLYRCGFSKDGHLTFQLAGNCEMWRRRASGDLLLITSAGPLRNLLLGWDVCGIEDEDLRTKALLTLNTEQFRYDGQGYWPITEV